MPPLKLDLVKSSLKCRSIEEFPIFIETGTNKGRTIFEMSQHFNQLHTIEISDYLYQNVVEEYNNRPELSNINFHLGDSPVVLRKLLPQITNRSIIFLDGHYSGGKTSKGDKDVPIYEEIPVIVSHHVNECIIIVDDVRLFGTDEYQDWSDVCADKILSMTGDRLVDSFYLESEMSPKDRLIMHLSCL